LCVVARAGSGGGAQETLLMLMRSSASRCVVCEAKRAPRRAAASHAGWRIGHALLQAGLSTRQV